MGMSQSIKAHQPLNSTSRKIISTGQLNKSLQPKHAVPHSVSSINSSLNTGKSHEQLLSRPAFNASLPINFTYKVRAFEGEANRTDRKVAIVEKSSKRLES
jgi:hypothetical protein